MGRKKIVQTLKVYLRDKQVGNLTKKTNGAIEFKYLDQWVETGFPISLSLPLADRSFTGDKASSYFDNLLPDSKKILDAIAVKFGAQSSNQFDILHAIGKECVGALSFFEEDDGPPIYTKMSGRILDESQIARKIKHLSSDMPLGMEDGDFRLSLAGAQEKMALTQRKGKWYEPKGQSPTSHIFKKKMGTLAGGIDFSTSVDNEYVCLSLAKFMGIDTCNASIEVFEDERILCVERFDRVWNENLLERIHVEDLCQALGVPPSRKYENKGGPGIKAIAKLLRSSNNPVEDQKRFIKVLMFNDLIFNSDGHAKNYSIFLFNRGYFLTPCYDLLSGHFLRRQKPEIYKNFKNHMSTNEKIFFKDIDLSDWKKEAQKSEIKPETFEEICHELSMSIKKISSFKVDLRNDLNQQVLEEIVENVSVRAKHLGLN
jgi:serine/threonine-protein kinase HipA